MLIMLIRIAGLLQAGELVVYDLQLSWSTSQALEPPSIALVLIEEEDIRRHGHPLTDKLLRRLIERLLAAKPRAIGIDLYRDQPVPLADGDPRRDTQDYLALGKTVTADDRVIMTTKSPDPGSSGTPPPRFLRDNRQVGFSDLPVDPGGTVRRGLLFMWDGNRPSVSLSLQLALQYLRHEGIDLGPAPDNPDEIRLGRTVVSPLHEGFGPYVRVDDGGYQFLLDYGWGDRKITAYGLTSVLDGYTPADAFRDLVVLVGTAAPSVKDAFFTPYSRRAGGGPMYGVEVHANAVDQLIRIALGKSRPLNAPGQPTIAAWTLLWALIGGLIAAFARSIIATMVVGMFAVLALVASVVTAFDGGLWLPLLPPLLAGLGAAGMASAIGSISERAQRRQLSSLFSRFQGTTVAQDIWKRRSEFLGTEGRPVSRRTVVTTLMADLEGYTTASEKLMPEVLMTWVNEYLAAAAGVVEKHVGVVDDYAGDGLKASFGFPAPSRNDREIDSAAEAAVRCGIAVGRRMEALNQEWARHGMPTARVRIGIFTGSVVVGFIGGDHALKYTTVGASVNIATRLEQFSKGDFADANEGTWRLLVGEETRRRTEGLFEFESMGEHLLKGLDEPIAVYRVLGEA